MQLFRILLLFIISLPFYANASEPQTPLGGLGTKSTKGPTKKSVAIIGSGIAGTTAAYFLHEYFPVSRSESIDITIYGSHPETRWRASSRYRGFSVENGGQQWSKDDWCMRMVMSETGLKPKGKDFEWKITKAENAGVWNGNRFIISQIDSSDFSSWWELAKDVYQNGYSAWLLGKWKVSSPWWDMLLYTWRYGTSPLKFRAAVLTELAKFSGVGGGFPSQRQKPFDGLETELTNHGLSGLILESADQYLQYGLNLSTDFVDEVVSPLVRARFGRDLEDITGLAALIAVRDMISKEMSIKDGNERLPYRLARLSEAKLELNTRVRKIEPGSMKRYKLSIESLTAIDPSPEFDAIIIAAPISFTEEEGAILLHPPSFVNRFITTFATDHAISHDYFNLSSNTMMPNHILTTANSSSSIYSITTLSHLSFIDEEGCGPPDSDGTLDCDMLKHETIYRILSSESIDDCMLAKMIGEDCGFHFPFLKRRVWPVYDGLGKKWRDDVEIFPYVFSAVGAEGIVESDEMSCRMGYNAMGKLYMKWRWGREKT